MADSVFVVRRVNWRRTPSGWLRLPGDTRLASFDTREQADAERRRLDAVARAAVNPFRCGGTALHHQTSLDADRLHDWFLDAGVEPPADRRWAEWWDAHAAGLPDAARARLWAAFDRLPFHTVAEQPRRPVVYALVRIHWEYNDSWDEAEPEGGTPVRAFRQRERAEAACAEANREAREEFVGWFNTDERDAASADPFGPLPVETDEGREDKENMAFFEVIETEWEGR